MWFRYERRTGIAQDVGVMIEMKWDRNGVEMLIEEKM